MADVPTAHPDLQPFDELTALVQRLDHCRRIVVEKLEDLDDGQAATQAFEHTDLTVGGIVKHLAWVEDRWFQGKLLGLALPEPWASAPLADDPAWPFTSSRRNSVAALVALYEAACGRSREATAAAASLDALAAVPSFGTAPVNLRWLLVHLIDETARHLGHLDLLRDELDGRPAGASPPAPPGGGGEGALGGGAPAELDGGPRVVRGPGEGGYARVEREQRWALSVEPAGAGPPRGIVDRYLIGTSLRVRSVGRDDGIEHKLGQKVRRSPSSPAEHLVTNVYLSVEDAAALEVVPARELRKTRRDLSWAGRVVAVDTFHGQLDGLVMAEVELAADEPWLDAAPPGAIVEVTSDDRFSGGRLAETGATELRALLAEVLRPVGSTSVDGTESAPPGS